MAFENNVGKNYCDRLEFPSHGLCFCNTTALILLHNLLNLVQSYRFSTKDRWSWRIPALAFPMRTANLLLSAVKHIFL